MIGTVVNRVVLKVIAGDVMVGAGLKVTQPKGSQATAHPGIIAAYRLTRGDP